MLMKMEENLPVTYQMRQSYHRLHGVIVDIPKLVVSFALVETRPMKTWKDC
jgi:hypothetical protein